MASLHFSRDTKVFISKSSDQRIWELPVLDGFSFSQATNASEITLNEMESGAGESRRARQMFNDSYAPAEWTFQTYMRPTTIGSAVQAPEEALWASMFFNDSPSEYAGATIGPIIHNSTKFEVSSSASNKSKLGTFDLIFVMGAAKQTDLNFSSSASADNANQVTIYRIQDCIANEASIDFDVEGITTINWSGFGALITTVSSINLTSAYINRSIESTTNFIRNRLTSLSVSASTVGDLTQQTYDVTLTGGNITFNNNITYLTPETLGEINQPLEHVTGTRNISGTFTAYLGTLDGSSTGNLFENLIEATSTITNDFDLQFNIGGSSGPRCEVVLPKVHLEIPQHSIEDVIALETTFHALPSSVDSADEVKILYKT